MTGSDDVFADMIDALRRGDIDALAAIIADGELRDIWKRWLAPIAYPDGLARAAD